MRRASFALTGTLAAGVLCLSSAGCHKNAGPGAAPPGSPPAPGAPGAVVAAPAAAHVDGTAHTDMVENAWRTAGLAPEGFAALQPVPYGASYCEEGRVQSIDTVVCEYHDQDALAKGQAGLMEQWGREGGHTGVAYHQKLTMIAVVDRARHDPNGKIIHQVIDTFRKL
ncbi:MAG TPA: hypothetical protein VGP64_13400 [Polyangia bacterium]